MSYEAQGTQPTETTQELFLDQGVCFDPDNIVLQGNYSDELSAHRARRIWSETLEANFLLERDHDFVLRVEAQEDRSSFALKCEFLSACARYAFWRLTNHQAPEAQYVIETAHIPICESRREDILTAPDMRSIHEEPLVLGGTRSWLCSKQERGISNWLKSTLERMLT